MIRLYLALGLIAFAIFCGWQSRTWYEDSKEKKVIIKKVENINDDILTLNEHTKIVNQVERMYEQKLSEIEPIEIIKEVESADCIAILAQHERVYNQAVRVANGVRIEDSRP